MLDNHDPFDIFDTEAARLERHFATLDERGWARPSRCEGWSVRDVLGHLAGEELYNHACLDGSVPALMAKLEEVGVRGFDDFNQWCVQQRRDLPVADVLAEWRERNGQTRERMRALGRDATLATAAGPYPVGLQTFHYCSEYATHADDVGAEVGDDEARARTRWRVDVGLFALEEAGAKVQVERTAEQMWVHAGDAGAPLSFSEFVEATVGRLPAGHHLDQELASALRCLA